MNTLPSDALAGLQVTRPQPAIALITLNRPERRNALSLQVLEALARALQDCEADTDVRAVVLTGGPTVFAAGSDLKELAQYDYVDALTDRRRPAWTVLRRFAKPLIAAVNGPAVGGGCELALHADIVIAGENARFGLPEINVGIMPCFGGTQLLPRVLGKSMAMKMVLTGELMSAQQALAAGLVLEVAPVGETLDRALALAARIATKAPLAVRMAKEAVLKSYDTALEAGIDYEFRAARTLWPTEDRREGIDAFLNKRPPQFRGR